MLKIIPLLRYNYYFNNNCGNLNGDISKLKNCLINRN